MSETGDKAREFVRKQVIEWLERLDVPFYTPRTADDLIDFLQSKDVDFVCRNLVANVRRPAA